MFTTDRGAPPRQSRHLKAKLQEKARCLCAAVMSQRRRTSLLYKIVGRSSAQRWWRTKQSVPQLQEIEGR